MRSPCCIWIYATALEMTSRQSQSEAFTPLQFVRPSRLRKNETYWQQSKWIRKYISYS